MNGARRRAGKVAVWLSLTVVMVFAAFPIYWMLNTALSVNQELFAAGQDVWLHLERLGQIPRNLATVDVLQLFQNSTFIAVGTMTVSLLLAITAAYALSRFKFHGKGIAGFFLFLTQMLPEALLLVPLFALFVANGLINRLSGLVLANTAFSMPVAVFIMKTAIDQIPHEIEESARIDGCPRIGQLGLIVVPLIMPSIAAAAVVTFFEGWNEFLFANTFLSDPDQWPASVGLAQFMGQYSTPLVTVMASALLFTLPAIFFFLLVQRRIISGLTAGAVKG